MASACFFGCEGCSTQSHPGREEIPYKETTEEEVHVEQLNTVAYYFISHITAWENKWMMVVHTLKCSDDPEAIA